MTTTGGRAATEGYIAGEFSLCVGQPPPEKSTPPTWKWTKLTDVARLETGHTPSRKHDEYWGGDIPWIGIRDATGNHGRTIHKTQQYTNQLGIENSSARVLPANTVCLSRTASVGYVVVMGVPMATSQDFVNWVCDENLYHDYLRYVLLSEFRSFSRFSRGTTHQTIYFPEVKGFHICLPPLSEQKAIAHILGTLDDKIELNRQTNKTLESIAQAIFKSWFVDFDPVTAKRDGKTADLSLSPEILDLFPDSFQDSELGEIPVGWEVGLFSDAVDLLSGGTPKTSVNEYWSGDIPWYTVKDVPSDGDVWVIKTDKHVSQNGIDNSAASVFKAGTAIISARGTVGKVCITGIEMAMNQSCYGVLGAKGFGGYFTYFNLLRFVDNLKQISHGSVFQTITRDTFKSVQSVYPALPIADQFETTAEPLLQKILANRQESATLEKLRDTLLPKLISGELRIKDAEKFLKDAPL